MRAATWRGAIGLPAGTTRFLARALPTLAVVLALGAYLGVRFGIGIDDQAQRCLPPYRVFLIDREDREMLRGGLVAFRALGLAPHFPDGTVVVKEVAALPGDRVEITPAALHVNGAVRAGGLALARTLGRTPEAFARTVTVPAEHLFVLGRTGDSFDSRYWGPLPQERLLGRAYALY
jgi:conjugal transfer pilin signal peptidase TrbI